MHVNTESGSSCVAIQKCGGEIVFKISHEALSINQFTVTQCARQLLRL